MPVITYNPAKATCDLRLGAAQLQHQPKLVTKLALVVRSMATMSLYSLYSCISSHGSCACNLQS